MDIFSKWRATRAIERMTEEKLFQLVHDEIRRGDIRDGLWAKAVAKSEGDDKKAKATYISMRVQSIKDELVLAGELDRADKEARERASRSQSKSAAGDNNTGGAPGHKGFCEKCGAKTFINYGNAYHTYCKNCM